jgi:hypothetical protein
MLLQQKLAQKSERFWLENKITENQWKIAKTIYPLSRW